MKKLYLEQQQVPITDLTAEQQMRLTTEWPNRWFVTKVVGSVTPRVRTHLSEQQVQNYCRDEEWQVEIV